MGKILVTGGAGYIGSHVVKHLGQSGYEVIVVDNLSNGFKEAVKFGEFIEGDIGDDSVLDEAFKNEIEGVLHFAGSVVVPESVENPLKYYENNTVNSFKLMKKCAEENVKAFIFSSTAGVYGSTDKNIVSEIDPVSPINPYASSKLMSEDMLRDISRASDLRHVVFRYFNVAGAGSCGELGLRGRNATHLMKVCAEAAIKKREYLSIFGTDYDTPDGTGVRDYIHVEDLADIHVLGLKYLLAGGKSELFNCGYSQGFSVKEVIKEFKNVSQNDFLVKEAPRRPGDVGCLIAESSKLKDAFNWKPRFTDISLIVRSAYEWEKKIMQ